MLTKNSKQNSVKFFKMLNVVKLTNIGYSINSRCQLNKKKWKSSSFSLIKKLYGTTEQSDSDIEKILTCDGDFNELEKSCFNLKEIHNCFIIQPYVKWGPKKLPITPEEQLEEAVALIKTLPSWKVEGTITIPLETLEKKKLFGSGNMEKLSQMIKRNSNITAVFINQSNLKKVTTTILQDNFQKPILDRYKIVIQILKMHAISKHAKLQVALAELYFLQKKAQQNSLFVTHDSEKLKFIFQKREKNLKDAILEVRNQRKLLKNRRHLMEYPVIAVVGYTNSGKTSIIKALTGEEKLQPRDQLFATLDVTVHEGILPSNLKVLFVDTVGFISDIPTNLLECFIVTLEDALSADVILHVEDLSSKCFHYKRDHVLNTLQQLSNESSENVMTKIMSVGNKCDIKYITINENDILEVSAKTGRGMDALRMDLESNILRLTSRQKVTLRVSNGSEEVRWLYKNSTVISQVEDPKNLQMVLVKVIITKVNLSKFMHYFVKN